MYTDIPCRIIHSSQEVETTQVSTDGLVDKQNLVLHNELLFSLKKDGSTDTCCIWMNLEDATLSEISQT